MKYILIEEVTYGEPIDRTLLEHLLALELIEFRKEEAGRILIAEAQCEDFRTMLRLADVLEINPAGIETIMHMRQRIEQLNGELRRLRQIEASYRAMRPTSELI